MKSLHKYGWIALLLWIGVLALGILYRMGTQGIDSFYTVENEMPIILALFFVVASGVLVYSGGYYGRWEYLSKLTYYQSHHPNISSVESRRVFQRKFWARRAKWLLPFIVCGVLWSVISYVSGSFQRDDLAVLLILVVLTIVTYWVYRRGQGIHQSQ